MSPILLLAEHSMHALLFSEQRSSSHLRHLSLGDHSDPSNLTSSCVPRRTRRIRRDSDLFVTIPRQPWTHIGPEWVKWTNDPSEQVEHILETRYTIQSRAHKLWAIKDAQESPVRLRPPPSLSRVNLLLVCGLVPSHRNHTPQSLEKRCIPERSLSDGVTMYETTVDPLSVPLVLCVVGTNPGLSRKQISAIADWQTPIKYIWKSRKNKEKKSKKSKGLR